MLQNVKENLEGRSGASPVCCNIIVPLAHQGGQPAVATGGHGD